MPELPEVEVSKMGITPHVIQQRIDGISIRQPQLRWRIPDQLEQLQGQTVIAVERRAKYLLLRVNLGTIIIHLGMSGSLRVLDKNTPAEKHDHVDLLLSNGKLLRYNDPRRFGAWLWQENDFQHELLLNLGPEPLDGIFSAEYMLEKAQGKRVAVKQFIMDNKVVVGVGNIYASESLFFAKIHPLYPAGKLTPNQWSDLVESIKNVLANAIKQGGTTLKDFNQVDGKPGYFAQELQVYGKPGEACPSCGDKIEQLKIGQRNSYFCSNCQPDYNETEKV
ncbi:bifunctional DNA-formamidopyrimidine glycosylase/DNA-(apurinic or apyrimidinic site) lyase [Vibrio sp. SCSIO 43137]|uniref:bifunctional DNA-formamidopyrimidine glycosylase/DNA-(apurinic or apyrimidinic site) lyase n=1 Tax=Vibrio sp. SCSIO 43137 TaxID=3021011 RepID=UPI00230832D4|nr:bifunctional DNA-formamidopyrimidine glycosylase/DNA-(apurinic or apyrimidinic site) lyase [Vibrio sp. SCSIO 43137]WCE29836.1 bifunctional DNA-formamidopyrimidine glycosylase/DNA-(apurinic or apyrimidinic site) lyase [Vibrio sp. SCSIO 43137]